MISNRHLNKLVIAVVLIAAIFAVLLLIVPQTYKTTIADGTADYSGLFNTSQIMDINIIIEEDKWQKLLENAISEEYTQCNVTINGETYPNVAIRAKGNTSLTQVASSDSDRFSFKIEFDHYQDGQTLLGLDKLVLNNLFSDKTYMKELIAYDIFHYIGVTTPLYTYADISINGEKWGLYLALEAMEDAYADRVYGTDAGQLYKPESDMGAGGKPGTSEKSGGGSDLLYSGEDTSNYSDIFDNSVFEITETDKQKVVTALKQLDAGSDLEEYIDVDACLRYFAAQTFVVNLDSYYSNLKHNYYLYEENGKLSILPWDLNLAFGGFQSGEASAAVNNPIDTPMGETDIEDRPLFSRLMEIEAYKEQYHKYLQDIAENYAGTESFVAAYDETAAQIAPYVKADVTSFYSYEEFLLGIETLKTFISLRAESVVGQLNGSIAPNTEGQLENSESIIAASGITLEAMGTQGGGEGGNNKGVSMEAGNNKEPPMSVTRPDNGEEVIYTDAGRMPGNRPEEMKAHMSEGSLYDTTAWIQIGISIGVAAAGIIFARLFKRRKQMQTE